MEAYTRKNEGMLLVCQDNAAASITIQGVNDVMERLLGWKEEELKGEALAKVLSPKHAEMVTDYVEFEEDARDLQAVLAKVSELVFVRKNNSEARVGCKVLRVEAKNRHHWFRLIVNDEAVTEEAATFQQSVVDNFKGHEVLDPESALPNATTVEKDLEVAHYYSESKNLRACYAYLRIDDFQALQKHYGRKTAVEAMVHVSRVLKRNLRTEDTIGRVEDNALGVILMDITLDSARVVLNRLRWNISSDGFPLPDGAPKKSLTVSVCLAKIGEDRDVNLSERASKVLSETPEPNAFLELYKG